MNIKPFILLISLLFIYACANEESTSQKNLPIKKLVNEVTLLNEEQASRLIELPLKCIGNPLPYKAGLTIASEADLRMPQIHHPAFYGCFDWHSAVHGHWSIVYLLKTFPNLEQDQKARALLKKNLTAENINKEIDYFSLNKYTKSFERTYGWAWVLKLGEELQTWDDPLGQELYNNLAPLCQHISGAYKDYLPKLIYPIRVGEHSNTAFGLGFALDYAITLKDESLENLIRKRAKEFYLTDEDCPITWEPSGYDFISPCLEEMNIMRRVLSAEDFNIWVTKFLPQFLANDFSLEPGKVGDRSDGKLVHLDGLNFSRAWSIYGACQVLGSDFSMYHVAEQHMNYSLGKIKDGDYAGEHWLASFALYALKTKSEIN